VTTDSDSGRCAPIALVDDATSHLIALHMAKAETTAYLVTPRGRLWRMGGPSPYTWNAAAVSRRRREGRAILLCGQDRRRRP